MEKLNVTTPSRYSYKELSLQPGIPTEVLAAALSLKAATLRRRLCLTGSYFGVVPKKLANGKLRWPAESIAVLLKEGGR